MGPGPAPRSGDQTPRSPLRGTGPRVWRKRRMAASCFAALAPSPPVLLPPRCPLRKSAASPSFGAEASFGSASRRHSAAANPLSSATSVPPSERDSAAAGVEWAGPRGEGVKTSDSTARKLLRSMRWWSWTPTSSRPPPAPPAVNSALCLSYSLLTCRLLPTGHTHPGVWVGSTQGVLLSTPTSTLDSSPGSQLGEDRHLLSGPSRPPAPLTLGAGKPTSSVKT